MKLKEKIYTCRKKAGLSQEALAERIGVSRQAVSKWETGDAEPELSKLRLLAQVLGVSADYLLNEAEDAPEPPSLQQSSAPKGDWAQDLPGAIGRLARRYGWLIGVYLAIGGIGFAGLGALARFLTKRMFSSFLGGFGGGMIPGTADPFLAEFVSSNPVSLVGGILIVLGLLAAAGGVLLAIVLKKKSDK